MERKMKDSGIPWIGMIPSDWEVKRLKEVFVECKEKSLDGAGELLSLSQYTGVQQKKDTDKAGTHESETYEGYNVVHKGQLVMNIMLAWNGSYAISDYDGIISPAYCVFDFRIDCAKRYFHYLLRTNGYPSAFKTLSRGIIDSRLRLYPEQFYTFPTIFPPLPTQQRIADILDRTCAEIDELAALQETMIAELKRYKQSVITEAVTKGLDKNVKMKDSGVEWIGMIPIHWHILKITRLLNPNHHYAIGDGDHGMIGPENYVESGIPYIRVQNLGYGTDLLLDGIVYISEEDNEKIKGSTLFPGDVLFAKTGATIGKTGIVPDTITKANTTSHIGKITVSDNFCPKWLMYVLASKIGNKQFWDIANQKTTRPELAISEIRMIKILTPATKKEQQSIADYLDKKCAEIDELIAIKQQKIEALKEYKKSVIFEYVTGKKEVGE